MDSDSEGSRVRGQTHSKWEGAMEARLEDSSFLPAAFCPRGLCGRRGGSP